VLQMWFSEDPHINAVLQVIAQEVWHFIFQL
jgi:hypothetical protein